MLFRSHRGAWSQELTSSPALLTDAVFDLLHRMRLIRPLLPQERESGWLLTAAAARYAPEVTR